jgi:hypothetical protein
MCGSPSTGGDPAYPESVCGRKSAPVALWEVYKIQSREMTPLSCTTPRIRRGHFFFRLGYPGDCFALLLPFRLHPSRSSHRSHHQTPSYKSYTVCCTEACLVHCFIFRFWCIQVVRTSIRAVCTGDWYRNALVYFLYLPSIDWRF